MSSATSSSSLASSPALQTLRRTLKPITASASNQLHGQASTARLRRMLHTMSQDQRTATAVQLMHAVNNHTQHSEDTIATVSTSPTTTRAITLSEVQKKCEILSHLADTWESALRMISYASKAASLATTSLEKEGSVVFPLEPVVSVAHRLDGIRVLMSAGKVDEAKSLLVLSTSSSSPRLVSLSSRAFQLEMYSQLVQQLKAIEDGKTLRALFHMLATSSTTGHSVMECLGRRVRFRLATDISLFLLERSDVPRMEKASIVLRVAALSPNGSAPVCVRRHVVDDSGAVSAAQKQLNVVTRGQVCALDKRKGEAALRPWSTMRAADLILCPSKWVKEELSEVMREFSSPHSSMALRLGLLTARDEQLPSLCRGLEDASIVHQLLSSKPTNNGAIRSSASSIERCRDAVVEVWGKMFSIEREDDRCFLFRRLMKCKTLSQSLGLDRWQFVADALANTSNNERKLRMVERGVASLEKRQHHPPQRVSLWCSFASVILNGMQAAHDGHYSSSRSSIRLAECAFRLLRLCCTRGEECATDDGTQRYLKRHLLVAFVKACNSMPREQIARINVFDELHDVAVVVAHAHDAGSSFREIKDALQAVASVRCREKDAAEMCALIDLVRICSKRNWALAASSASKSATVVDNTKGAHGRSMCVFPSFHVPSRSVNLALWSLMHHYGRKFEHDASQDKKSLPCKALRHILASFCCSPNQVLSSPDALSKVRPSQSIEHQVRWAHLSALVSNVTDRSTFVSCLSALIDDTASPQDFRHQASLSLCDQAILRLLTAEGFASTESGSESGPVAAATAGK